MTANAASVTEICSAHGNCPEALIEILHDVQEREGFISDPAMRGIAEALNISRAEVYGTASFYDDFHFEPHATRVKLCRAEACQAVGSEDLARACDAAGIDHETVFCLGNCALGPAAMAEGHLVGHASAEKIASVLAHGKGAKP